MNPELFYVGPHLKRLYWEATAVPELMGHVVRLVAVLKRTLVATVSERTGTVGLEALDNERW